jgi:hypothetical protein
MFGPSRNFGTGERGVLGLAFDHAVLLQNDLLPAITLFRAWVQFPST